MNSNIRLSNAQHKLKYNSENYKFGNSLDFEKNWYIGVFEVADQDFVIRFSIWRFKIREKLRFFSKLEYSDFRCRWSRSCHQTFDFQKRGQNRGRLYRLHSWNSKWRIQYGGEQFHKAEIVLKISICGFSKLLITISISGFQNSKWWTKVRGKHKFFL